MPRYEFECPRCGHRSAAILRIEERDLLRKCEKKVAVDGGGKPILLLDRDPNDYGASRLLRIDDIVVQIVWCEAPLVRDEIAQVTMDTKGSYQCGAILGTGEVVAGHFGKSAPRKGPRYSKG